jgi:glycosyltransferase involved in cell wall biosynthesis
MQLSMKKSGGTMKYEIAVLLLSWNKLEIVRESLERLIKEPLEIWVVDNGSVDGTKEYLENLGVNCIFNKINLGISKARNQVIDRFQAKYLLMLDSDILYIPGAAQGLKEGIERLPNNAYCLGIHSTLWDGTHDKDEADKSWPGLGLIKCDFPVAWTQFGLFKGDLIRKNKFPEHDAFGEPGYGFEDDYVNALMEERGYRSYYCMRPLYFHEAHLTRRTLGETKYKETENKRLKLLYKKFPNYKHWQERYI